MYLPEPLFRQMALLAYAAGIFSLRSTLAAAMFLVLVWFFLVRRSNIPIRIPMATLLLLAAFGAGALHARIRFPDAMPAPAWMAEAPKIIVAGTVEEIQGKPDHRLRILLGNVRCTLPDGRLAALPGRVVWTWQYPSLRPAPGQHVRLSSKIRPIRGFVNPAGWDTRFYWQCKNAFFRTYTRGKKGGVSLSGAPDHARATAVRTHIRESILQVRASAGRGLLMALLTGDRSDLYASTVTVLRQAALSHSLALSGLHLGIAASIGFMLAALLARLHPPILLRIPRPKLGVLLAAPIVLAYLWLGGFRPSLVRAAVMFAGFGLLLLRNQPRVLLDGLFLALAVLLMADPLSLFDLGMQMSFLAVAGIAVLLPLIQAGAAHLLPPPKKGKRLPERMFERLAGPLRTVILGAIGLLGCSLAANLALLPVCLHAFGQIPAGLWWNLFWLPLLGLVAMPVGFAGLALTCLGFLPGAQALAVHIFRLDAALLDFGFRLLDTACTHGLMPVIAGAHPTWPVILGYYLFFGLCLTGLQQRKMPPLSGLVLALCLLAWPVAVQAWHEARHTVRLTAIDVGQGLSMLVEHDGKKVLIDGGGTFSRTFDIGAAVVAPMVASLEHSGTGPRLHAVGLTHAQRDHSRGLLHPMRAFSVDSLLLGDGQPRTKDLATLQTLARKRNIPIHRMEPGQIVDLGDGVRLRCLYPPKGTQSSDPNDCSLTFLLEWNGHGLALLPGDLSAEPLREILADNPGLRCDVLVLPHHGSDTGYLPGLYRTLGLRTAIACCGHNNHFHFPGPKVRNGLRQNHVSLVSTGEEGAVTVTWNAPDQPFTLHTQEETNAGRDPLLSNLFALPAF